MAASSIGAAMTDKTILISGAASGIGRTIAETFLADGDRVHICDASADAIANFVAANPAATATQADVSNVADVGRIFEEFSQHYDHLDILINNAGISGPSASVEDVAAEAWDQCIAVNLSGAFYMTNHAVPLLRNASGGSIINMSSSAGLFGTPMRSPYAASKWGLIGLTKTWAMELGPHNIRVNAVCPGCVSGARIDGVIERDAKERGVSPQQIRDVYERQSSMRTFVSPEEIAATVFFLASDSAAKISGQTISVDGHTETLANWLD
jgi:NAD(P)-dependent dehydrogenase (short-subunit alcohol dehydrogenase family)